MSDGTQFEDAGVVLGNPESKNFWERNPRRLVGLQKRENPVALSRSNLAGVVHIDSQSTLRGREGSSAVEPACSYREVILWSRLCSKVPETPCLKRVSISTGVARRVVTAKGISGAQVY